MVVGKTSREISLMIAVKLVQNYRTIDKRALISSAKNTKKIRSSAKDMWRLWPAFRMEKEVGKELA
jgi:hypothetical protein